MVRLIKRYESRKLYDTEESRYVSLDEIARFVRNGQEVRVIDNASSDDVTAQTLTQIILEEGKNGRTQLPTEFLHDLVRMGERAWSSGVEQVQQGVDRFIEASMDRLGPVRHAREEMTRLRSRLEELEESLVRIESEGVSATGASASAADSKRGVKKAAAKKTASRRKKTSKTTRRKTT
jgi:polyhydroxyalkanoate synthesis repressor PhaR